MTSDLASVDDRGELSTYSAHWFSVLSMIEDRHFWFTGRNRLIQGLIECHFAVAMNFLEVGCGSGCVIASLEKNMPHIELTAGEPFDQGLEIARERVPSAVIEKFMAENIPYKNQFDLVGTFDVIEHIEDDEKALSEMYDAVKPGGGIIISVPQHMWLWSVTDEIAHHQRRYSRKELVSKVERAGFTVVRSTSFVTLLLPLMIVSRLIGKITGRSEGELKIVPVLNTIFRTMLNMERILILRGFDLPVGGSLFVVAKKNVNEVAR